MLCTLGIALVVCSTVSMNFVSRVPPNMMSFSPPSRGNGLAAAAIVAVNAFGDIRDAQGRIIAGARDEKGAVVDTARASAAGPAQGGFAAAQNTTLAIIAVDAAFTRVELERIAHSAAAAYHKRITPAGTAADGDIVFALAPMEGPRASLAQAEMLAVEALEQAIERAVRLGNDAPR
jgi:L-aminopeptidase/D-esterase-like protein